MDWGSSRDGRPTRNLNCYVWIIHNREIAATDVYNRRGIWMFNGLYSLWGDSGFLYHYAWIWILQTRGLNHVLLHTGWYWLDITHSRVPHSDSSMIGDRGFGLLTFRLTVSPPFSSVVDATGTTQSELAPELAGSVAAAFIPELYRWGFYSPHVTLTGSSSLKRFGKGAAGLGVHSLKVLKQCQHKCC